MNVFILNTGRCGSTTFIRACAHINNYSAGHETRTHLLEADRLAYPPNHIEADNRLSWFLGRLDDTYGNDAFYVHLQRNDQDTAASFAQRYERGIIHAYRTNILMRFKGERTPLEVSMDYCHTINSNIRHFLKDKTHQMDFHLEHAERDLKVFWDQVGAQGDQEAALKEWEVHHNASTNQR